MGGAPCGCDLRERAASERDPRAAAVIEADGIRAQKLWRCPRVCEPTKDPLPPACDSALRLASRLVGAEPGVLTACPGHYARTAEAHQVASLLPWYRKGQLHLRVPYPSGALVEAIDVTERALAQREADDLRRVRARAESEPKGHP